MRHIRGVHLKSFLKHQIPLLRLASVLMDRGLHIASKKNWTMILIHYKLKTEMESMTY